LGASDLDCAFPGCADRSRWVRCFLRRVRAIAADGGEKRGGARGCARSPGGVRLRRCLQVRCGEGAGD
jgi:hypothetical protein